MRHPYIVQIPNPWGIQDPLGRRRPVHSLAEKREIETKAPALRRPNIPGVIPPFRLKVRMIKMIAREFEPIIWKSQTILAARSRGIYR
jgi:hypothetical protein